MSATAVRGALYFVRLSKEFDEDAQKTLAWPVFLEHDNLLSLNVRAMKFEAGLSLAAFASRVLTAQFETLRNQLGSRGGDFVQKWKRKMSFSRLHATPIMDLPAMRHALTKPIPVFIRFIEHVWIEIESQMAAFMNSYKQLHQAPSATDTPAQKKQGEASSQAAEAINQQTPTPSAATDQAPSTPTDALKLPVDVIEAFNKGDIDALKKALGSGTVTAQPKTLQEQTDLEYTATFETSTPWSVALPLVLDQNADLVQDEIVRDHLGGLVIRYNQKTHSIRISLPENERNLPPTPKLSLEMATKFWRASAKILKWVEAMQERKAVIPLDVWVGEQIKGKKEKYKAMVVGYIDKLDGKKAYGNVTEASERSRKRVAEDDDQGSRKQARHD